MDGARLWEAQPYYARPFAEICGLFDSVYVSFYKGIGALSGAMLVGEKHVLQKALAERKRLGGEPYVTSYACFTTQKCPLSRRTNLTVALQTYLYARMD